MSRWLALVAVGLIAGFLSGLFGVGGGLVVVPALAGVLGLPHRRAVGTSLLAILPAAAASAVAYGVAGNLNLAVGGLLALGAVAGAPAGTWLLHRTPRRVAQWLFVAAVFAFAGLLLASPPNRAAVTVLDLVTAVGLLGLGVATGVLSALLGVGGGLVAIPVMVFGFGLGDLAAKGASLVMIVPTVLSGLVANLRRHNVAVRTGVVVGLAAVPASPLGAWVAHQLPEVVANWLFAAFLLGVAAAMVRQALAPGAEGRQELG